jgi:hypothetical protein
MGVKVTLDSLKKCYPDIDFNGLELIEIEVKRIIN